MMKTKKILVFLMISLIYVWHCAAQEITKANAQQIRAKIISCAKRYIGCPYQSGAIGPDAFDCSGLIYTVMQEGAGIQMPRSVKAIYSETKIIPLSQIEEGDFLFFKTTGDGSISHIGIYIGRNQFIHAASDGANTGVIVSSLKERYYENCFASVGRVLPLGRGSNSEEKKLQDDFDSADNFTAYVDETPNEKKSGSKKSAMASAEKFLRKSSSGKWYSRLELDMTLFYDWNFFSPNHIGFNWRGASFEAGIRYAGWKLQPGLGATFRYNHGTDNFQLPIVFSLSFTEFIKVYFGAVIHFGSPKMPGTDKEIKGVVFPGIFGISFQTPSMRIGKVEVALVQDLSVTTFKTASGHSLSLSNGIGTGLVLSTGIRLILPMSNF